MSTLVRHPSITRMSGALILANLRYWRNVAPLVGVQLDHWTTRAAAIPNPLLRKIALENLREEGFNAQASATLATLASPRYRRSAVESIVGLQVIYDYLDSLVEQPHPDPITSGRRLYRAFVDAIAPGQEPDGHYYDQERNSNDGGYLTELVSSVRAALTQLPSRAATSHIAVLAAKRCANAQVRAHATAVAGEEQLQSWASRGAHQAGFQWREFLAGAVSSGLALHALAALAATPLCTEEHAEKLDSAYLLLCAVTTLLDGLVDYEQDISAMGHAGYVRYYENDHELLKALENLIHRATEEIADLPHASHHLMTLLGVIAYYISAPTAFDGFSRPVVQELNQTLKPLITPPLALMRAWRLAKAAKRDSLTLPPS
jgi:tetraprenyl-beta-curcumene synthase